MALLPRRRKRRSCVLVGMFMVTVLFILHRLNQKANSPAVEPILYSQRKLSYSQPNESSRYHQQSVSTTSPVTQHVTQHVPIHTIPFMGDYTNCSDKICSQFLTKEDREKLCFLKRENNTNVTFGALKWPGACHFMDGTGRRPVALSSQPGSGNTWVRGLLEKVTGICTGAAYCDGGLMMKGGFHGEGLTSGTVLVVKDHTKSWESYKSAILLIRNPLDALVSSYHFNVGRFHTNRMPSDRFGNNSVWKEFVQNRAPYWKDHILEFVANRSSDQSLLVVKYEDMKTDRVKEIKRMLDFLGVPYSDRKVRTRIRSDYQRFHRHDLDYDHYTAEQRELVLKMANSTLQMLQNHGNTYGIEDYLQ